MDGRDVEKENSAKKVGFHVKLPSIKDFTIMKPISRGAFGKVFLGCKKNKPDEMYAIKVMKKTDMINKNMTHQVETERDALALSRSPFIVQLFYSLQSNINIFLVMEYMIGGDIKSLLHVYGYFDEDMAVFYASEAAQALQYLHKHNIVHRDLKPDNMLIAASGHMKLTDFGLSKITLQKPIQLVDLLGTPMYNSSKKYMQTRTPGQLLSLTSSLAFNAPQNGMSNVSSSASPFFPHSQSIGSTRSYHTAVSSLHMSQESVHKLHQAKVASSGSYSSYVPFHLSCDTPSKSEITCLANESGENKGNDEVHFPKMQQLCADDSCEGENLFPKPIPTEKEAVPSDLSDSITGHLKPCKSHGSSSSSNSSSSSTTPFCPKGKRKILHSRSTKNLREMRSSGEISIRDSNQPKLKPRHKMRTARDCEQDDNCGIVKGKKRPHPSLSKEDSKSSCSTGLTAVLSEIQLDSCDGKRKKLSSQSCKQSLSFSEATDDSVFQSCDSAQHSSYFGITLDCLKFHSTALMSDLNENVVPANNLSACDISTAQKKMVKHGTKSVNFCKETELLSPQTQSSHNLGSFRSLSESNSVASLAEREALGKSQKDGVKNSVRNSPHGMPGRTSRTQSTPIPAIHTPYRTPKSVRRGPDINTDHQVLGTPDYLAPELLLHQSHGFPVDWWALGVCFFEFLTGIPPFNDQTAKAVFSNILHRDVPWPEGEEALSSEARDAINKLLTFDAAERPGFEELKTWPIFQSIEWDHLLQREAPFIPLPDNNTDTTYFDARNNIQHLEVSSFEL